MHTKKTKQTIVEKQLGITPDYQYRALHQSNFIQSNWHNNKLITLDNQLPFNTSTLVLDLGPGSGNFELSFAKKVKHITAVDYHKEALNFLKQKTKNEGITNITTIHCDIRSLGSLKSLKKFDVILMIDVIEHIQQSEADKLIRVFKKLLTKNGKIGIITPNYHSLWFYIEKFLDLFTIVPHFDGAQHLAQYYPKNLEMLFKKNGFKTVAIKSFNTFSFFVPSKMLASLLCKLELLSSITFGNLLFGIFEHDTTAKITQKTRNKSRK